MTVRTLLRAAAFGAALAAASLPAAAQTLNFGIIATESSQNLKQDWQPVLDDMGKALGVKVNAFFAPDYAGIIEGMRFNKVQLAWMGNKSAMEAVDRADGEIFAQTVNPDGSTGYYSMVSVPTNSPYKTIDDLLKHSKDVSFGIGDPNSTSGFLVPSYYIFAEHHVDPKTAFKTIRSANHETNIMAVANGQVDAAVHSSDTLDRVKARQPEIAGKIRQIWQSPLIPADPLVWRKDLPAGTKEKIKTFFVDYGHTGPNAAQEKTRLAKLQLSGFNASSDAQLKPIRQLALFKEKTRLEADTHVDAADKKAKLEDLNRKLAELSHP